MSARWAGFDIGDLEPVVGTELTDYGWRGITADGEVFDVRSTTGVPESIMVFVADKPTGRRVISANVICVDDYLTAYNLSRELHRANRDEEALVAVEHAISIVDTARARFNRAMILLALGRWREGFAEFERCERAPPFIRPGTQAMLELGANPWRGESLHGKRLMIVHDHGFGDTIMMLRFVEALRRQGAISLAVPPELQSVAAQFGQTVPVLANFSCDYFTSFLHLTHWLGLERSDIPAEPYLKVDLDQSLKWRIRLGPVRRRRRIGVAWSVSVDHPGDFPRSLPLQAIVQRCPGAELHSLQTQGAEEAAAHGVITHQFADFADTAALMANLDEIVSVDTAAVHLAGAIGHPHVTLLLSAWHSWRWHGNAFYPAIQILPSGR